MQRATCAVDGDAAGKGGTVTLRGNLKTDDPTLDIDVSQSARGPGGPGDKAQVGTAELALFTAVVEDTGVQDTRLRIPGPSAPRNIWSPVQKLVWAA